VPQSPLSPVSPTHHPRQQQQRQQQQRQQQQQQQQEQRQEGPVLLQLLLLCRALPTLTAPTNLESSAGQHLRPHPLLCQQQAVVALLLLLLVSCWGQAVCCEPVLRQVMCPALVQQLQLLLQLGLLPWQRSAVATQARGQRLLLLLLLTTRLLLLLLLRLGLLPGPH
jgi:hypothetical protein